ncbi:winged helix-turn-helix domain-containing protein [Aliiglaciecola sp. CAU 1673]|uniref:winged helix-turn-helix domain-containing protein n=1 Tax=Aliiglaciecola sp. CAU 1673 TaxID=3032595 RepID=UPI0023DC3E3A|nr:winged helix-turn-helix domain-containing protein [Aliiglaciecola sp. CAU 1673]MDF2176731.1 winged helix-turn-helix domain-containing protein [Aliiglaciecola sp. CAU 1673]
MAFYGACRYPQNHLPHAVFSFIDLTGRSSNMLWAGLESPKDLFSAFNLIIFRFRQFAFSPDDGILKGPEGQVRLRPKTAELLTILLQSQGQIVTKQLLFEQLWPHTHVTEHTLSQSIRDLRVVLGDNPKAPLFIQTLPKRGFRWLVEVDASDIERNSPVQTLTASRHPVSLWFRAALLCLLLFGLWAVIVFRPAQDKPVSQADQLRLAILPTINATGDQQLDWVRLGFSRWLAQEVARSESVQVMDSYHLPNKALRNTDLHPISTSNVGDMLQVLEADALVQMRLEGAEQGYRLYYFWSANRHDQLSGEGVIHFPELPADLAKFAVHILRNVLQDPSILLTSAPPKDAEATQDLAKGVFAYNSESLNLAKGYFEAALIRQPQFSQATLMIAKTLFRMGQWHDSLTYLNSLSALPADDEDYLSGQILRARMEIRQGKFQAAEHRLGSVKAAAELSGNNMLLSECLWALGELRGRQGRWQEEQRLLQQVKTLNAEGQNAGLLYQGLLNYAKLDSPGISGPDIISDLQSAMVYFRRWQQKAGEVATLHALGSKGELPIKERIDYHHAALGGYRQMGDLLGEADTLRSLAWLYLQMFEPQQAQQHASAALALHNQMGAMSDVAQDRFYLGFAYLDTGSRRGDVYDGAMLSLAQQQLQLAVDAFMQGGMPERIPLSYLLLSTIAAEQEDYERASEWLVQMQLQALEDQQSTAAWLSAVGKAFIFLRQSQWQQCITQLAKAETLMPDSPLVLHYLTRCQLQEGNFDGALQSIEKLKRILNDKWQDDLQSRLMQIRLAHQNQTIPPLSQEPSPYLLMIRYIF